MPVDITPVIAKLLARNKGPVPDNPEVRQTPNYGVTANLEGGVIEMMLTFRAGSAYCCSEWGCHIGVFKRSCWDALRSDLLALGLALPDRLALRMSVVVENGALFFDWSRPDTMRRGWYAFAPVKEHQYQVVLKEEEANPAH